MASSVARARDFSAVRRPSPPVGRAGDSTVTFRVYRVPVSASAPAPAPAPAPASQARINRWKRTTASNCEGAMALDNQATCAKAQQAEPGYARARCACSRRTCDGTRAAGRHALAPAPEPLDKMNAPAVTVGRHGNAKMVTQRQARSRSSIRPGPLLRGDGAFARVRGGASPGKPRRVGHQGNTRDGGWRQATDPGGRG